VFENYYSKCTNEVEERRKHVCTLSPFGMEIAEAKSMSTPELQALKEVFDVN
jgi:hypothetical protein